MLDKRRKSAHNGPMTQHIAHRIALETLLATVARGDAARNFVFSAAEISDGTMDRFLAERHDAFLPPTVTGPTAGVACASSQYDTDNGAF